MSAARYTHGHDATVVSSHATRTAANSAAYLLPHLRTGMAVLDVGCGPGSVTLDLAASVAPGPVVGIEPEASVLETARAAAVTRGDTLTSFVEADVMALPWADDSFDVVHAHQVLQHLADPVGALREMGRVCRPGGIVAVRDADYEAMTWWPRSAGMDRWLEVYRHLARRNGAEPDAGRRLVAWAHEAGLADVRGTASAWCYSTEEERQWWAGGWAGRVLRSSYAVQAREVGLTDADLEGLARAWRDWASEPDGWFGVLHAEVLAAPPG